MGTGLSHSLFPPQFYSGQAAIYITGKTATQLWGIHHRAEGERLKDLVWHLKFLANLGIPN